MKLYGVANWVHGRYPDERRGEYGDMLITDEAGIVRIGVWDGFYWEWDGSSHLAESVKAWALLPEAYREAN